MNSSLTLAILVAAGAFSFGCAGKQQPIEQTTTHTETTTQSNTGERERTSVTTTSTEQPDGTQTVKRKEITEKSVPPPAPVVTPGPAPVVVTP